MRLVANVFDVWTFQRRSEMQAIGVFAAEVSSHEVRFEQVATRRLGPDVALVTGVRTAAGWRAIHDHSS